MVRPRSRQKTQPPPATPGRTRPEPAKRSVPQEDPPPTPVPARRAFRELPFLLLLLIGLVLTLTSVADEDIWWHLKTGEWILANRALPHHDLFTYTVPPDTPWHDTQWMFQVVVAGVHRLVGWNGLIALRVIWVWALLAAFWGWLRERGVTLPTGFLTALTVMIACRYRFYVRPETLTFALLALQVWGLDVSARRGRLLLVPLLLLQWFWGNWHSSAVLGVAVGAVFAAGHFLQHSAHRSRKSSSIPVPKRELWIYLLGLVVATLLNPNGWYTPALALTESRRAYILEFQALTWTFFVGSGGLVILLVILGLQRWRRALGPNPFLFAVVGVAFAVQSFRMFRFFPYFAIATTCIQAEGFCWLFNKGSVVTRKVRWAVAGIALGAYLGLNGFSIYNDVMPIFTFGVDESKYPVAAVDFLLRENIRGNLYNEMGNGGYLIYHLAPERKVFLFGETRLNGSLLERVMNTYEFDDWRKLFDESPIDCALFNCAQPPFVREGDTVPKAIFDQWIDWRLVFWDDKSMVFLRGTLPNRDLLERRVCRVFPEAIPCPGNPVPDLQRLQTLFKDRSLWPEIEKELLRAIAESPRHFRAALALGMLREQKGDPAESILGAYGLAQALFPDEPVLLQCLGRVYLSQGRYDEAIAMTQRAIRAGLPRSGGLYNIALVQWKAGRYDQGLETIERVLRLDPANSQARQLRDLLRNRTPPPQPAQPAGSSS